MNAFNSYKSRHDHGDARGISWRHSLLEKLSLHPKKKGREEFLGRSGRETGKRPTLPHNHCPHEQHLQGQLQGGFGGGEASESSGSGVTGKPLSSTTAFINKATNPDPSEKHGPQPPGRGRHPETPSETQGCPPSPAEPPRPSPAAETPAE